jgi:hypothetical protein
MPIGNVIKNLFAGGASKIIETVSETVDKFVMTKEEKEAAKLEIQKAINSH